MFLGYCMCFPRYTLEFQQRDYSYFHFIFFIHISPDKTLAYALETSTLTKRDRKKLNIFERKVYRGILGPVYDNEKENRRILTIKKFMQWLKNPQ
jgi:hypothetical protein